MVVHASIKGIVTTVTQSAWHSMLDSMRRSRIAMGMPVMPVYVHHIIHIMYYTCIICMVSTRPAVIMPE